MNWDLQFGEQDLLNGSYRT